MDGPLVKHYFGIYFQLTKFLKQPPHADILNIVFFLSKYDLINNELRKVLLYPFLF